MRTLWLAPVLALALTGCSAEPRDELRGDVAAVTEAANDGTPEQLRAAVEELLSTVRAQVAGGELSREEGQRISELALRIAQNADLLAPAPSPEPEPSPTPEPTEEPEPSPTPEPTEEPEPSPTPEPEPELTQEPPPPPPSPIVEVLPEQSPTPAQVSQPGEEPSPEASPAT